MKPKTGYLRIKVQIHRIVYINMCHSLYINYTLINLLKGEKLFNRKKRENTNYHYQE